MKEQTDWKEKAGFQWFRRHKLELMVLLASVVYLLWFHWLEQQVTVASGYHVIHVGLDDYIPFVPYFIVPYLLWFPYVLFAWLYLYRKDRETCRQMSVFLFLGMFTALFICTIYPNGTRLRPDVDAEKNVFYALVAWLYQTDTPTNVLPSIHVFNSIGVEIALMRTKALRAHRGIRLASLCLCVLICLSTMFLKQHSGLDVFTACMMAYVIYGAVYEPVTAEELEGVSLEQREERGPRHLLD